MKIAKASDDIGLSSTGTILTVRGEDMRRHVGVAWNRMSKRQRALAVNDLVQRRVVEPTGLSHGKNKVLLQGVALLQDMWINGSAYRFRYVQVGESTTAVDEAQTGVITPVNASASAARVAIVDKAIEGKILHLQAFFGNSEYVGVDFREASLHDTISGGTAYNRLLFTAPLITDKSAADVGVINIDHTITN